MSATKNDNASDFEVHSVGARLHAEHSTGMTTIDCAGLDCGTCRIIRRMEFMFYGRWYRRGAVSALGTGVLSGL